MPARKPWYPQSAERAQSFCKAFPDAEEFGGREGAMPWRFKAGLTPDQVLQAEAHLLPISRGPSCIISRCMKPIVGSVLSTAATQGRSAPMAHPHVGHAETDADVRWPCPQARPDTENWCGVLQEVALPGAQLADPAAFLPAAVQFANDRCWGNLSCSLFVSPQVLPPFLAVRSSDCEGSSSACTTCCFVHDGSSDGRASRWMPESRHLLLSTVGAAAAGAGAAPGGV